MKTIMHYLKTRALKQIAQWLIIAAFSILILGGFAIADAYAAFSLNRTNPNIPPLPITIHTYTCSDLSGSTGGTCGVDEGCMDFDAQSDNATWAAEICGPRAAYVDDEIQPFELHGWVWDDNIGWISLSCDANGENNGVACGSIEYGVKVDPTTGEMSGWAWNDNIGWISFMCANDGLNEGYACGGIPYGVKMNTEIGEDLGKISGYAWSDSVGWFDFETGTSSAKMLGIMMRTSSSETNWGIWTKAEIRDNTKEQALESSGNTAITKDLMPLANGSDGYDIFVHLADITGQTIEDSSGDVQIEISTDWNDTVKYDQTSSEPSNGNPHNYGPTYKAGFDVDARPYTLELSSTESTTGGIVNSYHGVTYSRAPTDGGNCYDGDGDGSCYGGEGDFLYKDFGENVEPNTLTYLGTNVSVTIPSTGETWTRYITPLPPYSGGRRLEFKPAVDIPTLDYLFVPGDESSGIPVINAIRNKVDEFNIQGATDHGLSAPYTINFNLSQDDPEVNYVFIDDLEDDPQAASSTFTVSDVAELGSKLLAIPFSTIEENLQEAVPGAKLITIVRIGNQNPHDLTHLMPDTAYYNNGLPRVLTSEIETQTAEIVSGSVFSPGAKNVVQGSDVPLFGDTAVYELRTAVLEDISSLIRGVNFDDASTLPVKIDSGTNIDTLYKNKFKDGRLYYFSNQDVTINDVTPLINAAPENKPITIVVKGGDLYLAGNIDADRDFGFIVFESDDDTNQATKGGRIYIHSDVTDLVNVHIFSDGPIFRYTDNVCYYWGTYGPTNNLVGLREPNFVEAGRCSSAGTFEEPTSVLVNQFYLKGNIASFNCLGCSTDLAPSRGDGQALGGPTALNFAIARLYDFNYFSYFRVHPITGTDSGTRSNNVTGNPTISDKDKGVYFEYSPAPSDLLGFRNF